MCLDGEAQGRTPLESVRGFLLLFARRFSFREGVEFRREKNVKLNLRRLAKIDLGALGRDNARIPRDPSYTDRRA
jgi:hypothetical protein